MAAATVPTDVVEALDAAATAFGDTLLAVRSSAVAEDLPDASFAGQYETVLNVQGEEALREAVRRVWASACSARAAAYRAARALPFTAMAVLVQRQVPAGAAGVAFSANPVTGDRHECLVSAVRGLGERLVAGHVTPDEWTVRGVEVVCRRAPEGALTADQARTVAELASRVEHHFGAPQDIEWALAEDRIWLLQARPITALPEWTELVPILAPPGFWQRDTHHQPLSPLDRSVRLAAYTDGMRTMFASTGALVDTIEYREIGGWLYLRVIPLGGK
ncbi:MAG: pyruvate, phosphate dikinase, partial [Chloroflexi bacterium]|nr:pyruvate, phosphate dikinase [Chloroflexota bacterium]